MGETFIVLGETILVLGETICAKLVMGETRYNLMTNSPYLEGDPSSSDRKILLEDSSTHHYRPSSLRILHQSYLIQLILPIAGAFDMVRSSVARGISYLVCRKMSF